MVKSLQNIESGYVGCDDEKINDMTTQPQWPNESGYGDQLQLSTYQEEQVQNVEETTAGASSDYQVDPTFTGVLNNNECLLIDELGDFDDFMGENQEWLSELVS
uniref:Uncharacterized protein n=1 Tax=Solanum tuberosum TaxID=4113 RepID=M1DMD0_SOLTU